MTIRAMIQEDIIILNWSSAFIYVFKIYKANYDRITGGKPVKSTFAVRYFLNCFGKFSYTHNHLTNDYEHFLAA